eukprot:Hpha_TRINITY_DN18982_c0_g1::TRINITY_DN18982_c0_g1_i1::g.17492::m.17492
MLVAAVTAAVAGIPRACVPPHDTYPFCNPKLSMDTRIDNLISLLTLEEKPYLMVARESPLGNVSRLGIPEYDWGGNCIHGVQSRCDPSGRCATSFPNPNSLGYSFNRTVWKGMGEVIGLELRSFWLQGVGEDHSSNLPHIGLDCWSPNIGIVRDPRWGRNLETPGEDPFLNGVFGSMVTQGLQNGSLDPRFLQAVVTLKHYDANSLEGAWGPASNITRHTVNADISMYDLHSTYLPAFRRSVVEGSALGVMCSYNAVNGKPSCANPYLLQSVLRDDWGFEGYVTSDSGAVADIYENHHFADTMKDAVIQAVNAGCDIESAGWKKNMPWSTGGPYIDYIAEAVKDGKITNATLDKVLKHSLGLRFKLGLFDPIEDQPYWKVPPDTIRKPAHIDLAVDSTRQSLVLLQNNRSAGRGLPFKAGTKVAVIGPHVVNHGSVLGNYIGEICADGTFNCVETVCQAVTRVNGKNHTTCEQGISVNSSKPENYTEALAEARSADAVIYVGGLDTSNVEREGLDRHDVGLPGMQLALLKEIAALGKPLGVVLFHGGVVVMDSGFVESLPAVISAGYPGFFGAGALADALFDSPGKQAENRWGKLSVTWHSTAGWEAANYDMLDFNMAVAPGRTYRYYTGNGLLWGFGHGLSYAETTLTATASESRTGVTVNVTNNDKTRACDEVVMVYMKAAEGTLPKNASAAKLQRQLVDFERVGPIAPGASATLSFSTTADKIQVFDENGKAVQYAGEYDFVVSTGAEDTERTIRFSCKATGVCKAV